MLRRGNSYYLHLHTSRNMMTPMESSSSPAVNGDSSNGSHSESATAAPRRSQRGRKPRASSLTTKNEEDEIATSPVSIKVAEGKLPRNTRRNPARKAAPKAGEEYNLPDNLLEETVAAIKDEESADWQGWVELESEPVSRSCPETAKSLCTDPDGSHSSTSSSVT